MIKVHLTERLTLRRRSEIGFKPVGIEHRDERLHGVEWRSGFGDVFGDVSSTPCEDGVNGCDAISRCLDLNIVYRFKKTGSGLSCGDGELERARIATSMTDLPSRNWSSRRDEQLG